MNKENFDGVVLKVERLHSMIIRLIEVFNDAALGFTLDEFVVLSELFNKEGVTQNYLAAKLFKDKSNIKRTVDKLEKKGIVKRDIDINDKRKYSIHITESGRRYRVKLEDLRNRGVEWLESSIGKDVHEEILSNLSLLEHHYRAVIKKHCKEIQI